MTDTTQKILEGAKDITNDIANKGTQIYGDATTAVSSTLSTTANTIGESVDIVKNTASQYLNNISSVIYALIALIIVSVLVGFGLYYLITDKITYQQSITVSGTEVPILCNQIKEFKILENIDNKNGNRRTFAFWIYINDINKYKGDQYRHIAHIGDSAKDIAFSSPYIILDKDTNKIHFRFAINNESDTSLYSNKSKLNEIINLSELTEYVISGVRYNCGFTIPYVPIQRWVHIVISINDNNNGSIYTYVDAELVEVIENKGNTKLNVADLKLFNKGNLFTGGDINDSTSGIIGFSGLISKFTIYNQDLNQNDIYKEYNNGPFSGLLTKLGLNAYGIRNPIYKINNE